MQRRTHEELHARDRERVGRVSAGECDASSQRAADLAGILDDRRR